MENIAFLVQQFQFLKSRFLKKLVRWMEIIRSRKNLFSFLKAFAVTLTCFGILNSRLRVAQAFERIDFEPVRKRTWREYIFNLRQTRITSELVSAIIGCASGFALVSLLFLVEKQKKELLRNNNVIDLLQKSLELARSTNIRKGYLPTFDNFYRWEP
jgi:hypothetical protein